MKILTKEKSNQKRKGVYNQNNSANYFRLWNTEKHHHHLNEVISIKEKKVVLRMGSTVLK
jgi:hypothetical protein